MVDKAVTLTRLTVDGDGVTKTTVQTLVKERVLDLPYMTVVNGTTVNNYDDLLSECLKHENPQVMQFPIVVGG